MTGASGAIRSAPGEDCCQVFVLPQFGDLPQRPGRRAVDAWRDPVVVVGTNARDRIRCEGWRNDRSVVIESTADM
jgi:hypothetical protein